MPVSTPIVEDITEESLDVKEPSLYQVLIHNDDKTTIDFVIFLLQSVFHKSEIDAIDITYRVHVEGVGVVGVFTQEIAMEKVSEGIELARINGFPLVLSAKPE